MKNHLLRRVLSMLLVVALLAGYYVPGAQAASTGFSWKESDQEVRLDLTEREAEIHAEEHYAPTDLVRVSIVLEDKPTVQAGFATRNLANNAEAMAYSRSLRAKQDTLAKTISTQALGGKKLDVVWNLTLVGNIISANVPYGKIASIAEVEGVARVIVETVYEPCVIDRNAVAEPQMYASLRMTGSSLTWSSGYTGAGSRVAVIDTGTDTDHQSLDAGAFLYSLEQNAKAAGVSYEAYLADLDLLDEKEIAAVLTDLNIYEKDSSLTAAKLYLNEKLPFAVNYVDSASRRLVVDHASDEQSEHGSHVAGITTANRYIPSGSGYADAMQTVLMAGTAPDAQLVTMKVFGYNGGPSDADYLAAVEDAILLGCDAVNLSLGSSVAGNSMNSYFADVLEYLTTTDTVVVASAGNAYSWPITSTFGYLYSQDVNMDTVGAPGSYYSFLSVASVENDGGVGPAFQVGESVVGYNDLADGSYYPFTSLDTSDDLSGTAYEYVFIDGLGYPEDYAGMDLEGKIVFCSRGDTNFAVKANNAADQGAAATIIYNNTSGILNMDLSGYYYTNPCVSITQAEANTIRAASKVQTTAGGLTYYTGTMTVLGRNTGVMYNSEYLTMSDFSSWGVPGDLSIKPEITAPGGNIYSIYGETPYGGGVDQYELMSGTSMAAPSVTGMAALMAQYLRESGLAEQENMSVRHLAQSLLMSTAVPMMEADSGNYYSIMKQGAGLARVDLATSADSYILVDGQSDGKVKAELGDDPNRTGVYEFSFSINNLTDKELSYALSAELFRQDEFDYGTATTGNPYGFTMLDTWTTSLPGTASFTADGVSVNPQTDLSRFDLNGDGQTDAADADYLLEYLLENESTLYGQGDVDENGLINTYDAHVLLTLLSGNAAVTVPAGGSVTIGVTLTLTENGKALLDAKYENGTYVEAFVYAESIATEEGVAGTKHSIPVLAFYGNWTDPNMFDHGSYVEIMHGYEGLVPYLYQEIGSGNALTINYGDGSEYYFGGNPIVQDDAYMTERNAFNSEDASYLMGQYFTLIRGSVDTQLVVSNADTGEIYMHKYLGGYTPAFYFVNGGYWVDTQQGVSVGWSGLDANGDPLPEDTNVEVSLIAIPEYYLNEDGTMDYENLGDGIYLTTRMTIDNTAPEVNDMVLNGSTLTVKAKDNQYVAAVVLLNGSGSSAIAYTTPNQTEAEAEITLDLDLTNVVGKTFQLVVCDYAMNQSVYEITLELPEVERPYFTVVDYPSSTYYGLDADGTSIELATGDRGMIMAAEFVDGYVFEVSGGNVYYASDDDLNNFRYLTKLDADYEYGITNFLDLAYNYDDGKLYGLFYAEVNYESAPYLCTIDMFTGEWQVLYEMPVDVNNMAIDGEGNFYSVAYNTPSLYTYTLDDLAGETMSYVGEVSYYATSDLNSLAWDHNTDTLYWAYPNTLLQIDHTTGEPTLLSYFTYSMTGLYIRPETWGDRFAPTDRVDSVAINLTESRVLLGTTLSLTAQVLPWNVSDNTVTWTSSDSSVATVDANGTVTGVSVGQATITATSNLDKTKSASCLVSVEELNKTLNAVIWDEEGSVWWSEFNTTTLPSYTKLTETSAEDYLATTAVLNGKLYAATADMADGQFRSTLYEVDPQTFDLSTVGVSSLGYTDMAPAPNIRGGCLAATYGSYIIFVDMSTGDFYSDYGDYFQLFTYQAVGIAYAGSTPYQEYGYDTVIDWYYIVDAEGFVYLMGWLEQDGELYYLEHPYTTEGVFTVISATTDTPYFSSLYTDGEFVYYSCYNSEKDNATLYAIDTTGNRKCYTLGDFGQTVWPAGGLVELDTVAASADILNVTPTMKPKAVEKSGEITALRADSARVTEAEVVGGGLNTATDAAPVGAVDPHSSGEFDEDIQEVTVVLTPAGDAPNGRMTVTYDPDVFVLAGVTGNTEAFAYIAGEGTVTVAFASAEVLDETFGVATLTFELLKYGEHTVTVDHVEAWDEPSGKQEILTVSCGCAHSYQTAIIDPTCTEQGYTLYYCEYCDDTYKADYQDPLGHSYEDGYCVRCGEEEYFTQWISATTSLNGTIDLNIYVALSNNILNDPNAFVRFIRNGVVVDVPMSEAVEAEKRGQVCYRFSCEIYAKQVADTVTIQVMNADGAISDALEYSVMKYCNNQIKNSKDPELVALCKALLNYATAAQTYFNYNTGNLANASLSDADKVLPEVDASAYKFTVEGSEEGILPRSATLMLESVVAIRVYFIVEDGYDISDYTFTIDGKEVPIQQNEKGYYIESDGIPAKELDNMHQFTVGGLTVNYGALSYVNSKAGGSNVNEANLAKALYAYYVAAEALLG